MKKLSKGSAVGEMFCLQKIIVASMTGLEENIFMLTNQSRKIYAKKINTKNKSHF